MEKVTTPPTHVIIHMPDYDCYPHELTICGYFGWIGTGPTARREFNRLVKQFYRDGFPKGHIFLARVDPKAII